MPRICFYLPRRACVDTGINNEKNTAIQRNCIPGWRFAYPDIEHVAQQVAQEDDFGSTAEYVASIREALDSETQLSLLIPQPHSEAVIRSFLSKLLDRLSTAE